MSSLGAYEFSSGEGNGLAARRENIEDELRRQTSRLEALNRIGRNLAANLDLDRIVQAVTDEATQLSGARFGAFFYNVTNREGESYQLYSLSGAKREAFDRFGQPRNTAIFDTTFRGDGIVRSDDIRKDPRYGLMGPHYGLPKGHLPVVSYLAVPVISRSGEVHGGLFLAHDEPGVFTADAEEIVSAIAAHASIAIDNARLLEEARREVEQRRRVEASLARQASEQEALFQLTDRLHRAKGSQEVFEASLTAIQSALECQRASILLFDEAGVMRFVAWRGLSEGYRNAVEGHSPWTPDDVDPEPIMMGDLAATDLGAELAATIKAEGIEALSFIPLLAEGKVVGKFMAYYDTPHEFTPRQTELALTIARQLGFSVARLRAEVASQESEQRLRLALEAGRMGAWEWDTGSGVVNWSPGLEKIHGLQPGSFGGTFEDFTADMHPDDQEQVFSGIRQSVETRNGYHVVYRIIRPDGEMRWVEAIGRFVPGEGGKAARLAGVCTDVTERRQAEEQRNLLVAELSHRVKNTLATVMSIARQSFARATSLEGARATFEARLHALSQAHSRLAEANWSGVALATLLSDELAPYRRADNIRIGGDAIVLNPKCALTLGLAIHELATNAAKYGALSTNEGMVRVEWSLDRANGLLRLHWSEEGGPRVVAPKQSGFGRLLLERALVADLRGEVQLDFAESGLRCGVVFPIKDQVAIA